MAGFLFDVLTGDKYCTVSYVPEHAILHNKNIFFNEDGLYKKGDVGIVVHWSCLASSSPPDSRLLL
jgi:hypothetical protein